jgi:Lamin Tail Domain
MMLINQFRNSAFLLISFIFFTCTSPEDEPVITAGEGLYINEVYSAGNDWIELYNATSSSKDISNYKIYDDGTVKYPLPSGTIINANSYLVILCNDVGVGLEANFRLSSAGETVHLENTQGKLVDFVVVPKLDNGQSYGRFPDGSSNLAISGVTSQGVANPNTEVAAVTSIKRTPIVPALNQAVSIQAEVTNSSKVQSIQLFYRFNNAAYTAVNMIAGGVYYTATIPGQNATGKMDYYIEVTSTNNLKSYKPFDAPTDAYNYLLNTDPLPILFINEIMPANLSCCADTDSGTSEFDDWFEIYNPGANAINLAGMYVSDDPADPFKYKIPNTNTAQTTIQANGYLVFWADEQSTQGLRHANFKLSAMGESVGLYYIDGRKIDEKSFPSVPENKTYGRTTNGGSTWNILNSVTQGTSNN